MYGKPMDFIDWLIDMPEEFSFWVEDQIAVMSPVTIAVVIVVALAVLAGIWLLVVSAAKKDVRNTSEILAGIEEVNQGYEFYDVDEEIRLEYPLESLEEYRVLPSISCSWALFGKRFLSLKRFSDGRSRM